MSAYRVIVQSTEEGWLLKRPGWPGEWFDDAGWATRAAESLAFEFHERSGRGACVVLASNDGETELRRFG
ncbi:hypothetical protein [Lysobacter humi (ex Lee et al. 2017)]